MLTIVYKKLQEIEDTLKGTCVFWACEGPDVEMKDMKTCVVCHSIQLIRDLKKEITLK